jgi:type IV secretion system protein TrbE
MTVDEPVHTYAGDDSEGLFAGFIEYRNLYILLGGLFVTLVVTLGIWNNRSVGALRCFTVGSLPFLSTLVWVFGFRQGKPKAHDRDVVQTAISGNSWQPSRNQGSHPLQDSNTKPRFTGSAPNGWFCDDLLVWNSISKGGYTSKGYVFEVPAPAQSSVAVRSSLYASIRRFMHTLDEQTRVQFCWSVDSDYKAELSAYHEKTSQTTNEWSRVVRTERFNRYFQAMLDGRLRRERLVVYVSRPIVVDPPATLSGTKLLQHYEQVLAEEGGAYEHCLRVMRSLFDGCGCRIRPMSDEEHFLHFTNSINPSLRKRFGYDPLTQFDRLASIQENVWNGANQGSSKFGFFYDGSYHNLVLLKRRPQRTRRGIIEYLTQLPFLDYSITVNLYPLNVKKEIVHTEQSLERVRSSLAASGKHRLLTSKQRKEEYISELSQGDAYPFRWDFVVHVWDDTELGLISKTRQIEAAINKMDDAQYWTTNLSSPATTRNMWYQTWPGWLWGKYTHQADTGIDKWLADLLPFSSSFTGHLNEAEALYDGHNSSLVGIRTFVNDTPQLAAIFGMTRAGKSVFLTDLLSQVAPYYEFMLLLEEGLSYGIFTEANGSKPIIVHPDGTLCINYLDTNGAPLSNLHIDMAASLVCKLVGTTPDPEKSQLRKAQVRKYIEQLYNDYFQQWCIDHREKLPELTRLTIAAQRFHREMLPGDATFLEAWTELRDRLHRNDDRALTILADVTEGEVSRFLKDPATERLVRNCLFATFEPTQHPQHADLHDEMLNHPLPEHNAREIADLATLLEAWNEQALVSGHSTIRLQGSIAHFELGQIPDANMHLKEVAAFLIANYARQHIISLPRGQRKLVLFEECARTLNIPGGQELVSEFYAQLSKFSTEIISSVQTYSMFKNSPIRPVVMGNSAITFFTKFADRADLDDISRDVGLSESAKEAILRYPRPDHLPESNRWSAVTYHHLDAQQPVCGSLVNRTSPAVNFASSSTGRDFDRRARVLRGYPNVIEGIMQESERARKEEVE